MQWLALAILGSRQKNAHHQVMYPLLTAWKVIVARWRTRAGHPTGNNIQTFFSAVVLRPPVGLAPQLGHSGCKHAGEVSSRAAQTTSMKRATLKRTLTPNALRGCANFCAVLQNAGFVTCDLILLNKSAWSVKVTGTELAQTRRNKSEFWGLII
jgi:hypothetical protein